MVFKNELIKILAKGIAGASVLVTGVLTVTPITVGVDYFVDKNLAKCKIRKTKPWDKEYQQEIAALALQVKKELADKKILSLTLRQPKLSILYKEDLGIQYFPTKSTEVIQQGSLLNLYSIGVGIPLLFSKKYREKYMNSVDDQNESVSEIKQFLDTYDLDQSSLKFILAKQLTQADDYIEPILLPFVCASLCAAIYVVETLRVLLLADIVILLLCVTIPAALYFCKQIVSQTTKERELAADTKAASLGPEIAQGGIDYYKRMMIREELSNFSFRDETLREFSKPWYNFICTPLKLFSCKPTLLERIKNLEKNTPSEEED